ncbi:MAG: cyanophycinase [Pirellula sp.]
MKRKTVTSLAIIASCFPAACTGYGQSGGGAIGSLGIRSSESHVHVADVFRNRTNRLLRGRLLLCGGGLIPPTVLGTFFRSGGGDQGNLVIIPTASPRSDLGDFSRHLALWNQYTWKSVSVVHVAHRDAASDATVLDPIRNASAVWLAGGDQRRLVERFQNTLALSELLNLLDRGGIVGGTSAGAAIASKVMIAGGITRPTLQEGWGILPDLIIDQHFSQRGRFERLARAVQQNRDQVGLGIDESTGILFEPQGVQVLGAGAVYAYLPDGHQTTKAQSISVEPNAGSGGVPRLKLTRFASGSRVESNSK